MNGKIIKLSCLILLVLALGCRTGSNSMVLVNYARPETPEKLGQTFNRGYFTCNAFGEYEILLESTEPISTENNQVLHQSLYLTTIWKPMPGRTYADSSQINAKMVYLVKIADHPDAAVVSQTGQATIRYQGTGFVVFDVDRSGNVLTGTIEQALMQPAHKKSNYRLGTFELSGSFRAVKDPAAVAEYKLTYGAVKR
ncbi:MAG: hypothetical protein GX629_00115 [Phycisphaerae bacterium]|jgi:hypothetical protein|nr:hypothetical protein [Phycisphaerae bacterium]